VTGGRDSWRPTPVQELLLEAALREGPAALEAWDRWRAAVDLQRLDGGYLHILPLLYTNLRALGVPDPSVERFRHVYRATWYANQLRSSAAADVSRAFEAAGIEVMLLKGAALSLLYYRDPGLRPMQDLDVLVHPDAVASAARILQRLGWQPSQPPPRGWTDSYLAGRHAQLFAKGSLHELDLHWHALAESRRPGADDDFWEASVPLNLAHGVSVRAMNPTDQLLHVCAHGIPWNPVPPLRWVADAVVVLRQEADGVDWDRLVRQAECHRVALALADALEYLRARDFARVPREVVQALGSVHASRADRILHAVLTRPPEATNPLRATWAAYAHHARNGPNWGGLRGLAHFVVYLGDLWNVRHVWQVPFAALSRGGRVLGRSLLWRLRDRRRSRAMR
jgi:hypothetical protein